MRRKLFIGGLGLVAATVLLPAGSGNSATLAALDCPGQLGNVCGVVDLVVGTACGGAPVPSIGTVGPVTLDPDLNGPVVSCPELPI